MADQAVIYTLRGSDNNSPGPAVPASQLRAVPDDPYGLGDTVGNQFDAHALHNDARRLDLEFRHRYFACTQHDHKVFDWNGRLRPKGRIGGTQPLLGAGSQPTMYISLDQRRPIAPFRLGRAIVNRFTAMLFGVGSFPAINSRDEDTQDMARALSDASSLPVELIKARTLGGACGTSGLSWEFRDGVPVVSAHSGRYLHVLDWEDLAQSIPAHVVQLYQFEAMGRDPKGKRVRLLFWHRRDWTRQASVVFKPQVVESDNPVQWTVDEDQTEVHDDGFAHFVWIQNTPDDEPGSIDGQPDYQETYEQLDGLDILNSVNVMGTTKNLDPTLVLKMEQEVAAGAVVQKGSENALVVGENGEAKYLELAGTAHSAGDTAVRSQREQILETTSCVIPDPNVVAAAGTSSVALKMLYAPMLAVSTVHREPYGRAIVRTLDGMLRHLRRRLPNADGTPVYEVPISPDGQPDEEPQPIAGETVEESEEQGDNLEEPVEFFVRLPPRIVKRDVEQDGETVEEEVEEEHTPGAGDVTLDWPDFFTPTSDDRSKEMQATSAASAGKASISQQTAVELSSEFYGRDPREEWRRVLDEQKREQLAMTGGMFPGTGGGAELEPTDDADPNALPRGNAPEDLRLPSADDEEKLELAPTDLAAVVLVNEARASMGLPPLTKPNGSPDPNGWLTVSAFKALAEASGTAAGDKAYGEPPAPKTPPAAPPGATAGPPKPPAPKPPAKPPGVTGGGSVG